MYVWYNYVHVGVDEYDHHDVLQDIEFKEGMKSFS